MKIKYTSPGNMFAFFNDSLSILIYRKKILKTKKYSHNYLAINVGSLITSIICLLMGLIYKNISVLHNLGLIIILISVISIILSTIFLIPIIPSYKKMKKDGMNGSIEINETGITNEEKIKTTFYWNDISYVIVGKYSINIITNSNWFLRIPIKIKNKLLKEIPKYSNVEIINLTDENLSN